MSNQYELEQGCPHPLGATPYGDGVNFSFFSENATAGELLLFKNHDDRYPFQVIDFDPVKNRTFSFWHVFVKGLKPGINYAYRIDGPQSTLDGHRFNKNKVLIDPYAKGNVDTLWDRVRACDENDNLDASMHSVVIDIDNYDWEGDESLKIPMKDTIIYETHVGGFTKSQTSDVHNPGTFLGLTEKVSYLKDLGINAVELLPVFEYDDKEILKINQDGTVLQNYWGYSTLGFFAPDGNYCVNPEAGKHINEFRDMVKALHKAGIQVILDVVFNHTNEGNHHGPTIGFKGFDNSLYYYLVPWSKNYYMDYTGCGNTFNCNHPIGEKFITECLEFWVKEMHVDGFRFDEGSVLSRGEDGVPLKHPPILWNIELSETLADTKLIAEAWDAAGLYQIGGFPGYRWAEWNGKFRDDIRRFVKGDSGIVSEVASRISGSSDLYQHSRHNPLNSINFVTCHDGFTMMDLVSYNSKHNDANGEGNCDGINDNLSWNCGAEGETDDINIINLRKRQMKNFLTILFISQGVPMLLGGDEIGRTQKGNNNAYCQDNEISWMDWGLTSKNNDLLSYASNLIDFRMKNSSLRRGSFFNGDVNDRGIADVSWHGCKINSPGWDDPECSVLAFTLGAFNDDEPDIHVMMNMHWEDLDFEIPKISARNWYLKADTSKNSTEDFLKDGSERVLESGNYKVESRSIVILISK